MGSTMSNLGKRLWQNFQGAQAEREAARCERVLDNGARCPLTATQDVDGDKLCDDHTTELDE